MACTRAGDVLSLSLLTFSLFGQLVPAQLIQAGVWCSGEDPPLVLRLRMGAFRQRNHRQSILFSRAAGLHHRQVCTGRYCSRAREGKDRMSDTYRDNTAGCTGVVSLHHEPWLAVAH
ncbi:hypothetical protein BO71DRAFT_100745 [Aspergillus ellipticus CBS 707.79]|uniref:Secreted protein n=1 Tax=Aspergillus ellipticus CBS 707.79 TaxID=1448320 RepID=A0A319CYD6_9EURO|nr:hypothetical protein BO71DRAFT_100745 [Aspergillus ellipticus CBS 707.79]